MSELALILSLTTVLLALFVVLTERKFLAYAQRRMGPAVMGRNGALQIALDLVKLLTKEIFLIPRPTSALAPVFLALLYGIQLMFSQNFVWGPSLFIFENVDSLILYHLILVLLSNIFLILVGLLSQSRYAIIGTIRAIVHTISLDIFVTILYSLLVFSSQSANFHDFINAQNIYWFFFLYSPAASAFVVVLLLESKRAPFDHSETESEVVAGYAVEYSGPMLMIFFLAEYLHLIISSVHFVVFFIGGWYALKIFWFLPPIFLTPHDVNYWYELFNIFTRI
jgi:NADH:ubiquinone oxidoreductase subunit H